MKKLILIFTYFLFLNSAWGCPGCAGSMGDGRDKYTVYILMVFIALTYIPFFILYKTIIKYRNGVLETPPVNEK